MSDRPTRQAYAMLALFHGREVSLKTAAFRWKDETLYQARVSRGRVAGVWQPTVARFDVMAVNFANVSDEEHQENREFLRKKGVLE